MKKSYPAMTVVDIIKCTLMKNKYTPNFDGRPSERKFNISGPGYINGSQMMEYQINLSISSSEKIDLRKDQEIKLRAISGDPKQQWYLDDDAVILALVGNSEPYQINNIGRVEIENFTSKIISDQENSYNELKQEIKKEETQEIKV